jgi:formate dehydrogenase beta subunit
MKSIMFGRWGNTLIESGVREDSAGGAGGPWSPAPTDFPREVVAIMCGKGFLQFDEDFAFVPMIREYVRLIQTKYCCAKCITGIKGSKIILSILDRMVNGGGDEKDLELLGRMAEVLNDAAKCSVCQTAGELVLDGLKYYGGQFVRALKNGVPSQRIRYLGAVSSPCMNACPCHINIPGYVEMLQELRYAESLAIIRQEMPLPGVTGRVCPAPCETACSMAFLGAPPIPIKSLKRTAADYERIHRLEPPLKRIPLCEPAVAVVGAGPAGIAAAFYLNRLGRQVTVFDAHQRWGGMTAVGIPPYRQPRDVLDREVAIIRDLGVKFELGRALGRDFTVQGLFDIGFGAVFLGLGAHKSLALGIKGEGEGLSGVFSGGVDFLRDVNLGLGTELGEHVAVVGGGNTALDCARTCLRLGAARVSIIYRRTKAEMPADPEEVADAQEEGVQFHFLTQPVEIMGSQGRMTGLRCVRTALAEPDKSGRRRPIPVEGSEFDLDADTVIPAIGQQPDLSFLSPEDGIEVTRRGAVKVDPVTMMTRRPGVFAAGDAVSGPLTVVHAMAGGKRAAFSVHEYLTTGKCLPTDKQRMESVIAVVERDRDTPVTPRIPGKAASKRAAAKLDVKERISHFREVDSGFTQKTSYMEAGRCLRCFHLILAALRE